MHDNAGAHTCGYAPHHTEHLILLNMNFDAFAPCGERGGAWVDTGTQGGLSMGSEARLLTLLWNSEKEAVSRSKRESNTLVAKKQRRSKEPVPQHFMTRSVYLHSSIRTHTFR